MSIKTLSDSQLHQNLLTLKSKESRVVASIVSHLEEVYRRRLFAKYKCSSIYDYCIKVLGYSNGDAHKKISACKLASQCEGVKEAIASGELSLSNAATVQMFLNKSAKLSRSRNAVSPLKASLNTADEKTTGEGVVGENRVSELTVAEGEVDECAVDEGHGAVGKGAVGKGAVGKGAVGEGAVAEGPVAEGVAAEGVAAEGVVSKGAVDKDAACESAWRKAIVDKSVADTEEVAAICSICPKTIIDRVKNLSTRECELELGKIAKENGISLPENKPTKRRMGEKTMLKVFLDSEKLQLLKSRLKVNCEQELLQLLVEEKLKHTEPRLDVKPRKTKYPSLRARGLSPSKRAKVINKAQNKCENCGSKFNLQVDHKLSVALGGSNDIKNLRLLCRSCNQRAAIEQLGLFKMNIYINKRSGCEDIPQKTLPSQKVKLR